MSGGERSSGHPTHQSKLSVLQRGPRATGGLGSCQSSGFRGGNPREMMVRDGVIPLGGNSFGWSL